MFIQPQDARLCLDVAEDMGDAYQRYCRGDGAAATRSIKELLWICNENLQIKITVDKFPVELSGISVRGACVTTDVGYQVFYIPDERPFWDRLVVCKEMFHAIIDNNSENRYRTTDIAALTREVADKFPKLLSHPGPECVSEIMAEIAAMEFLFPYRDRVLILNPGTTVNYATLAEHYRVPALYIERYLSPTSMKFMGAYMGRKAA